MSGLDEFINSIKARLIIDGKLVCEVHRPGGGTPDFPGHTVEELEPGEEGNAIVEVVVADGQKQTYNVRATPK